MNKFILKNNLVFTYLRKGLDVSFLYHRTSLDPASLCMVGLCVQGNLAIPPRATVIIISGPKEKKSK